MISRSDILVETPFHFELTTLCFRATMLRHQLRDKESPIFVCMVDRSSVPFISQSFLSVIPLH